MVRLDDIVVLRFRNLHRTFAVETLAKAAVKRGGMCCVIRIGGQFCRQAHQHLLESLDAAGRCADDDDLVAGR